MESYDGSWNKLMKEGFEIVSPDNMEIHEETRNIGECTYRKNHNESTEEFIDFNM